MTDTTAVHIIAMLTCLYSALCWRGRDQPAVCGRDYSCAHYSDVDLSVFSIVQERLGPACSSYDSDYSCTYYSDVDLSTFCVVEERPAFYCRQYISAHYSEDDLCAFCNVHKRLGPAQYSSAYYGDVDLASALCKVQERLEPACVLSQTLQ